MKNEKWMRLRPRFTDSLFDGYDVVTSSHLWDDDGKEYEFVPKEDYELLKADRDQLRSLFDSTAALVMPGEVDTSDAYLYEFKRLQGELAATALCLAVEKDNHCRAVAKLTAAEGRLQTAKEILADAAHRLRNVHALLGKELAEAAKNL
jgi:hypothetical protein